MPCGAELALPDVFAHPHTKHRKMVVEKDGYRGFGVAVKLSRTPGGVRFAPRPFAADGRAILKEAGYAKAEIEKLVADGILVEQRGRAPSD